MFRGRFEMAGVALEVSSIYEDVQRYCAGYETDKEPQVSIEISPEDIAFERKKSDEEFAYEGLPLPGFSEEVLEITAVYRKLAERLPALDRAVFHGSVIAVDGEGYLFTASSGTGKSTHTRLWRELFGDRAVMVNDDKPILHVTGGSVVAYGTPYNGKHRLGSNISVPLRGICILERAQENSIRAVTRSQAYAMLLQQIYRPRESSAMRKTMELIDRITENTGLYRMGCNMDISAAQVAYDGMKG